MTSRERLITALRKGKPDRVPVFIKGNIQVGEIMSGDVMLVRSRVREATEAAGREGAFILSPTASPYEPVLTDRVYAGYKAMVEEALDEWS